jgi:hypothetical protein
MEVQYFKIRNPKTGRMIDAYGTAFNNLIESKQYTEKELLSGHKYYTNKQQKALM